MDVPDVTVLFRSRAQILVLDALCWIPLREWALSDLVRIIGLPQPTVSREVSKLTETGLVFSRLHEGRRYAEIDSTQAIFPELRVLVGHAARQERARAQ
jgi:DNA-binding transcriptional ArsR family regulator